MKKIICAAVMIGALLQLNATDVKKPTGPGTKECKHCPIKKVEYLQIYEGSITYNQENQNPGSTPLTYSASGVIESNILISSTDEMNEGRISDLIAASAKGALGIMYTNLLDDYIMEGYAVNVTENGFTINQDDEVEELNISASISDTHFTHSINSTRYTGWGDSTTSYSVSEDSLTFSQTGSSTWAPGGIFVMSGGSSEKVQLTPMYYRLHFVIPPGERVEFNWKETPSDMTPSENPYPVNGDFSGPIESSTYNPMNAGANGPIGPTGPPIDPGYNPEANGTLMPSNIVSGQLVDGDLITVPNASGSEAGAFSSGTIPALEKGSISSPPPTSNTPIGAGFRKGIAACASQTKNFSAVGTGRPQHTPWYRNSALRNNTRKPLSLDLNNDICSNCPLGYEIITPYSYQIYLGPSLMGGAAGSITFNPVTYGVSQGTSAENGVDAECCLNREQRFGSDAAVALSDVNDHGITQHNGVSIREIDAPYLKAEIQYPGPSLVKLFKPGTMEEIGRWTVDVETNSGTRSLTITRSIPSPDKITTYTANDSGVMSFSTSDANTSTTTSFAGNERIDTVSKMNGQNEVASVVEYRYEHTATQPDRFKTAILDPAGAALTTQVEYDSAGHIYQVIAPSGKWTRYIYDNLDRVYQITTGKGNAGPTAAASELIVTTQDYDFTIPNADNDLEVETPRLITTTIGGTEVSRSYNFVSSNCVWNIACPTPENPYYDTNNIITKTWVCTQGAVWTFGRPRKIQHADGTRSIYSYDLIRQDVVVITVLNGVPDPVDPVGVVSGTRTTIVQRPTGQVISTTTQDLQSNVVLAQDGNYGFNSDDRPRYGYSLDGSTYELTYSCCGLESVLNSDGTSVHYTYDARKRVETETIIAGTDEVTYIYAYNGADQVKTVTRNWGNEPGQVIFSAHYDLAGRTEWTKELNQNLDLATTHYNYTIVNGQPVTTTVYPNNSTSVVTRFKDGTVQSVTGDAVAPLAYESAVETLNGTASLYLKTSLADASGQPGPAWSKVNGDALLRPIKKSSSILDSTTFTYNNKGQFVRAQPQYQAGRFVTYNTKGEIEYLVHDLQGNGQLNLAGSNRVIRTATTVETSTPIGAAMVNKTYGYLTLNSATETLLSEEIVTPDGKQSLQRVYNNNIAIDSKTSLGFDAITKIYSLTNKLPDNSYSVSTVQFGYPKTTTQYGAAGQQLNQKTFVYEKGQLKTVTDSLTGTTTYNYYPDGRLQSATSPAPTAGDPAQTVSYTYNAIGQVEVTTLPDNSTILNEYYPNGKIAKVSGSQTYPTAFAYDIYGRRTYMTNWGAAGPQVTQYIYDATTGVMTKMLYPGGRGITNSVDVASRTYASLDANGFTTTTFANTAGDFYRVDIAKGSDVNTFLFDFDRRGRVITQGESASGSIAKTYNDLGMVTSEKTIYGTSTVLLTNQINELGLITNSAITRNGIAISDLQTTYGDFLRPETFTQGNLVATAHHNDTSLTKTFDIKNSGQLRILQANTYDKIGRLKQLTTTANSGQVLDSHTYNFTGLNKRASDTRANGARWEYGYDSFGQLTNATAFKADNSMSLDGEAAFTYDTIGNALTRKDKTISGLYASATPLTDGFNTDNQLVTKALTPKLLISGTANPVAGVTLNSTPATRNGDEFQFAQPLTYTANQTVSFGVIGAIGTPTSEVAVTNTLTQFVPASGSVTFVYDNNGNLTQDERWTNTWDRRNQLTVMESAADQNNTKTKYTFGYDVMGRRQTRTTTVYTNNQWTTTETRNFVYHGWKLAAELDGNTIVRTYTWAGSRLLWATDAVHGTYIPTYDGNGNVTRLISATDSTVLGSYEYGPFGDLRRTTGALAERNPIRFSSEFQDPSGLIYYGLRYYSPVSGRWLSKDPIGYAGGVNLYGFVGNDPVNRRDYLGMWTLLDPYSWFWDTDNLHTEPITSHDLENWKQHLRDAERRREENSYRCGAVWDEELEGNVGKGLPQLGHGIAGTAYFILEFTPQGTFSKVVLAENMDGTHVGAGERLIGATTSVPGLYLGGKAIKLSGVALQDLQKMLTGKTAAETEAILANLAKGKSCVQASKRWPKHHPWPQYLGGLRDQTLKKMPLSKHKDFHYDLDHWKDGLYSRAEGAEHFKNMDPNQIIQDLTEFYTNFESGKYREYLPDFERAVEETLGAL